VLALSLASGHARKELIEEEPYPYQNFWYRRIGGRRVRVSTHELASCEKDLGLGPWS
jgi:hypothetical protein